MKRVVWLVVWKDVYLVAPSVAKMASGKAEQTAERSAALLAVLSVEKLANLWVVYSVDRLVVKWA